VYNLYVCVSYDLADKKPEQHGFLSVCFGACKCAKKKTKWRRKATSKVKNTAANGRSLCSMSSKEGKNVFGK